MGLSAQTLAFSSELIASASGLGSRCLGFSYLHTSTGRIPRALLQLPSHLLANFAPSCHFRIALLCALNRLDSSSLTDGSRKEMWLFEFYDFGVPVEFLGSQEWFLLMQGCKDKLVELQNSNDLGCLGYLGSNH